MEKSTEEWCGVVVVVVVVVLLLSCKDSLWVGIAGVEKPFS